MSTNWLLAHDTIVALAITGGALSLLGWVLSSRRVPARTAAAWCNRAAYAFMGASMLLFIIAGLVRP